MVFGSHACACALDRGARNRSGFMKTSAATVRPTLTHGLDHPSANQTARAGLVASSAIKLYRTSHG
jgi:hypothetical protein